MRIIFLDIDGVLINEECLLSGRNVAHPDCVAALNWLTEKSGAGLVITSTWRIRGFGYISTAFRRWGIKGQIVDMTPRLELKPNSIWIGAEREVEIREWLNLYYQRSDATRLEYVILDDDAGPIANLSDRLVQTSYRDGLTMQDAKRALAMFNREG